jgi:biotin operon repressor
LTIPALTLDASDAPTFENEVFVLPGRCVAWECYSPVPGDGIACGEHAWDFEGRHDPRGAVLTADDKAKRDSMTPLEWERYRKRMYRQRKQAMRTGKPVSAEAVTNTEALKRATAVVVADGDIRRAARRIAIVADLKERGFVSTADIATRFGLSRDAIGQDLRRLEAEGVLERVYGGGKLPGSEVRGALLRRPRENP